MFPQAEDSWSKKGSEREGAGREGCVSVCWSISRVPSGKKLLMTSVPSPQLGTTYPPMWSFVQVCVCVCVRVCARTRVCSAMSESAAPWTVACQAPLSMEFSRQEHWSELPFPPSGDLPDPGIKSMSPESPALAGRFFTTEPPLCR